jgi:hypothetical protein
MSGPLDTAHPAPGRPAVSYPGIPRPAALRTAAGDPFCETAITSAGYFAHLPSRLLGAISMTESGRVDPTSGRVRPWPCTINAEGEGQVFETRQQAVAVVKAQ